MWCMDTNGKNVWLGVYDYLSGHEMTTQSKDYKKLQLQLTHLGLGYNYV